jgi:hypothetical protein
LREISPIRFSSSITRVAWCVFSSRILSEEIPKAIYFPRPIYDKSIISNVVIPGYAPDCGSNCQVAVDKIRPVSPQHADAVT